MQPRNKDEKQTNGGARVASSCETAVRAAGGDIARWIGESPRRAFQPTIYRSDNVGGPDLEMR